MSTKTNLTQNPPICNGQTLIESRALVVALVPEKAQPNITQLWNLKASEAIQTLISFQCRISGWQADGRVDDKEFLVALQRLDDAGLSGWMDELIGLAVTSIEEGGR